MTIATSGAYVPAGSVLFAGGDGATMLESEFAVSGVAAQINRSIGGLSDAASSELERQYVDLAMRFLELNISELLLRTFRTYDKLRDAAIRTNSTPGSVEVVELFAVPIPWTTQADVRVIVDGRVCFHLQFGLSVVLEVNVVAVVRYGHLTALRGGQVKVTVTLTANEIPLMTREAAYSPAALLPLGRGISLAPIPPRAPRRL